jgi:hypothetical protein
VVARVPALELDALLRPFAPALRCAPQPDRHCLSPERRFQSLEAGDDRSFSRL